MEKMRAGRLIAPGTMACETVEVVPPEDGDVVVRTAFASICGSDLHSIFLDLQPREYPMPPGYPGHEGVGEVVESRHPAFSPGDRVLTAPFARIGTCFNEYQTLPGAQCVRLPDDDTPIEHMLMAQQLGTVIWALRQRPVDVTGATVVVIGQGSAGTFFTQLLRLRGAATIITSDLSAARRRLSESVGADVAVDPSADDLEAVVAERTDGLGAHYVVEAVGARDTLLQSTRLACEEGHLLWFGLPDTNDPVLIDFRSFFRKRLTAHSTYNAQAEPKLASFAAATAMIANGVIDAASMVSHVLPIEDIDRAMHLAHDRSEDALKVSIRF